MDINSVLFLVLMTVHGMLISIEYDINVYRVKLSISNATTGCM